LKITILFTSGETALLKYCDAESPALFEADAADFSIAGMLWQKFKDNNIHHIGFLSCKLSEAEFNHDVYKMEW